MDRESAIVHLVSEESVAKAPQLAETLASTDDSWLTYALWLAAVYPEYWIEFAAMAKKRQREGVDLVAALKNFGGLNKVIEDSPPQELIKDGIMKLMFEKVGLVEYLAVLPPEIREEIIRRFPSNAS